MLNEGNIIISCRMSFCLDYSMRFCIQRETFLFTSVEIFNVMIRNECNEKDQRDHVNHPIEEETNKRKAYTNICMK